MNSRSTQASERLIEAASEHGESRQCTFARRLVLHAFMAAIAMTLVCVLYPHGRAADEQSSLSFVGVYAWIFSQSLLIALVPLAIGLLLMRFVPRWAFVLSNLSFVSLPIVVLFDAMFFHLVGERLLSETAGHILSSLLPGLMPFVGYKSFLLLLGSFVIVVFGAWSCLRISRVAASNWPVDKPSDVTPAKAWFLMLVIAGLIATPALYHFRRTTKEMANQSYRYPGCAFRIFPFRSVGIRGLNDETEMKARVAALSLHDAFNRKVERVNELHVVQQKQTAERPDVVLFVLESWRVDTLTKKNMPELMGLMDEHGRQLPHHLTGGNSTSIGMFSLLHGLQSVWFERSADIQPLMPRLMQEAGYEIGFFGGADDWSDFQMETYIAPQWYDEFQIEPVDWLASDQRSVREAEKFLDRESSPSQKPRMAIVFLYSSHKRNDTIDELEVFQPAYEDQNYVVPYTDAMRPMVFNRYRNAVRALDHLMMPLLERDRVVIAVGDHGESFLDDGTIGHGSRLSEIQCATPAMVSFPDRRLPELSTSTYHADILPTLLSGLGIKLDGDEFEGVDLFEVGGKVLKERTFGVSNYLSPEILLVGPWTLQAKQPYGFRGTFSIRKCRFAPYNSVDHLGLQWDEEAAELESESNDTTQMHQEFSAWCQSTFGENGLRDDVAMITEIKAALSSSRSDDRRAAIQIAGDVMEPDEALIDVIELNVGDADPEVRKLTTEVLIRLQRRRGNLEFQVDGK